MVLGQSLKMGFEISTNKPKSGKGVFLKNNVLVRIKSLVDS